MGDRWQCSSVTIDFKICHWVICEDDNEEERHKYIFYPFFNYDISLAKEQKEAFHHC